MTDMVNFFNIEQAKAALVEAKDTKRQLLEEVEKLNKLIIIIEYFLATGEELDPRGFGLNLEDDDG